ncbi:MAG: hypothetical protein SXV54_14905 [Chloroflexota bacterium]|nr:hypothetical protein [Chloroflexota bacterium]
MNGTAVAQDGAFEAVLHTRKLLIPVELGVRNQARVIVEESEEKDLALAGGIGGVGQVKAMHSITLPQVAKVGTLETAVGLGALLGQAEAIGSSTGPDPGPRSGRERACWSKQIT